MTGWDALTARKLSACEADALGLQRRGVNDEPQMHEATSSAAKMPAAHTPS